MRELYFDDIWDEINCLPFPLEENCERWIFYAVTALPKNGVVVCNEALPIRVALLIAYACQDSERRVVIDCSKDKLARIINETKSIMAKPECETLFDNFSHYEEADLLSEKSPWIDLLLTFDALDANQPVLNFTNAVWPQVKSGSLVAYVGIKSEDGSWQNWYGTIGNDLRDFSHFFSIKYGRKVFELNSYLGTVHVIIPVHNRVEQTLAVLKSLHSQTAYSNIAVHIVNDGSTDGTSQKVNELYPWANILEADGSLFWTGAAHYALEQLRDQFQAEDYFILMNNDIRMSSDAIEILLHEASIDRKCCLVPAAVGHHTAIKTGWGTGIAQIQGNFDYQYKVFARHNQNCPIWVSYGRCTMFPSEVLKVVGNYNHIDFPHYHGDTDYGQRVSQAGFHQVVTAKTTIYVIENAETSGLQASFFDRPRSLGEIYTYLTSIHSIDCIKYLWKYAVKYNRHNRFKIIRNTIWRAFMQHKVFYYIGKQRRL